MVEQYHETTPGATPPRSRMDGMLSLWHVHHQGVCACVLGPAFLHICRGAVVSVSGSRLLAGRRLPCRSGHRPSAEPPLVGGLPAAAHGSAAGTPAIHRRSVSAGRSIFRSAFSRFRRRVIVGVHPGRRPRRCTQRGERCDRVPPASASTPRFLSVPDSLGVLRRFNWRLKSAGREKHPATCVAVACRRSAWS